MRLACQPGLNRIPTTARAAPASHNRRRISRPAAAMADSPAPIDAPNPCTRNERLASLPGQRRIPDAAVAPALDAPRLVTVDA